MSEIKLDISNWDIPEIIELFSTIDNRVIDEIHSITKNDSVVGPFYTVLYNCKTHHGILSGLAIYVRENGIYGKIYKLINSNVRNEKLNKIIHE